MSELKINSEHLEILRKEVEQVLAVHNSRGEMVAAYERGEFHNAEKTKDLQQRFCFDILYGTGLTSWVCRTLYEYLDDSHIYSALRSLCPVVKDPRSAGQSKFPTC